MNQYILISLVGLLLASNAAFFGEATTPTELVDALNEAVEKYQAGVDNGIYVEIQNNASLHTKLVTLPGDLVLTQGLVTLPLDFLCQQPGVLETVTCHVCSYDCTFVHNKYGGQCGDAPNPVPGTPQEKGELCICNDVKPPNVANISDVVTQCGPVIDRVVDMAIDLQVAITFRERMFAVQCLGGLLTGFNSVGCNSDCTTNHNYASGVCKAVIPVAVFLLEDRPGINCYCAH